MVFFDCHPSPFLLQSFSEGGVIILRSKQNRQITVIVIVLAAIYAAAIFGGILLSLNSQKNTEEYQLAYRHLVSSSDFESLDIDESFIFMNQHYSGPNRSRDCDSGSWTQEFGFLVGFHSFYVVCHQENDVWQICSKCTSFD